MPRSATRWRRRGGPRSPRRAGRPAARRREVEGGEGGGDQLVVVAMQPMQVEVTGRGQLDLLLGTVGPGGRREPGRPPESAATRPRSPGWTLVVAGHQVPVGRRIGRVAAARAAQAEGVAGRGGRAHGPAIPSSPWTTKSIVSNPRAAVPLADRVGADLRPLLLRRALARKLQLQRSGRCDRPVRSRPDRRRRRRCGSSRGQRLDRFDPPVSRGGCERGLFQGVVAIRQRTKSPARATGSHSGGEGHESRRPGVAVGRPRRLAGTRKLTPAPP